MKSLLFKSISLVLITLPCFANEIYVNQVGFSAKILDFAYRESFLYGLTAIFLALIFGGIANYLFARFIGK